MQSFCRFFFSWCITCPSMFCVRVHNYINTNFDIRRLPDEIENFGRGWCFFATVFCQHYSIYTSWQCFVSTFGFEFISVLRGSSVPNLENGWWNSLKIPKKKKEQIECTCNCGTWEFSNEMHPWYLEQQRKETPLSPYW